MNARRFSWRGLALTTPWQVFAGESAIRLFLLGIGLFVKPSLIDTRSSLISLIAPGWAWAMMAVILAVLVGLLIESRWMRYVLPACAIFTLLSAVLFALASGLGLVVLNLLFNALVFVWAYALGGGTRLNDKGARL